MRQRVGLARALCVEPSVLLMDEPFSSLDPLTAESLREEVLQLWRDPTLPPEAVVLVTHNIEEALLMADRVLVLSRRPGGSSPGVLVNLPRPRDRKSEAFYALTDYVYSLVTEGGAAGRDPRNGAGPPTGSPALDSPLPSGDLASLSPRRYNAYRPGPPLPSLVWESERTCQPPYPKCAPPEMHGAARTADQPQR